MTLKNSALHAIALVVACTTLSLQAQAFEDSDARRNILKLREQVKDTNIRIDNEIDRTGKRVISNEQKLDALVKELEKLNTQLRTEVKELRGQVEVATEDLIKAKQEIEKLSNDLANARRRENDLYADVEKRLSKLEPRRQSIDGTEYEVTQAEQKLFDDAVAQYKKKDFAGATQSLIGFLQRFPGSGHTSQAYYLLGNSYFAQEDCKNALPALQTVVNRFPMTQRAPDAMLNIAICQDDLNDKSGARETMEALVKKYPGSPAAASAKSKLGTLK
jgi:tol-pal system protein YbgF